MASFKVKTTQENTKDMLNGMQQRASVIERMGRHFAESMMDSGIGQNCLNCDHWNTDGTYGKPVAFNVNIPHGCTRYKMMPPPNVLVTGCDEHTDQIPF